MRSKTPLIPIANHLKLTQGLAINAQSKHLVSKKETQSFPFKLLKISSMQNGNYDVFISKNVNKSVIANSDDIIYTRTGQIGEVFRGFEGVIHNNSFKVQTADKTFDKKYLELILNTSFTKNQANVLVSNSMQPDITHDIFREILLPYFDMPTQKSIAEVLSTLDDKIKLNKKQNETLEEMAKTIYEYWFIQNKNNNWKKKKLSDILYENKKRADKNIDKSKIDSLDLSIMPSNSIALYEKGNGEDFASNDFELKKYDMLFGSIRPYLRKAGISSFDGLRNGSVLSFQVNNKEDYSFALCTLTSETMFKHSIARSGGSTRMPTISSEDILDFDIYYDKETVKKFNDKVGKFWDKIIANVNENYILTELRDFLLPLLMNGQVTVKD